MRVVRPEASPEVMLRVEVGAAYDLVLSLAAAAHPDRYELPPDLTHSVRHALPATIRKDVTFFFGDPLSLGAGAIQLIPELPDATVQTFLTHLDAMDPAVLIATVLSRGAQSRAVERAIHRLAAGKRLSPNDQMLVDQHVAGLSAETRRRFDTIIHDAAAASTRFSALMHEHAGGWFAEHYPALLPGLLQRAKQGRRTIGKLPAKEVIARVTGGFTLQDAAARSALLVPSYYAAPFVFVVGDEQDVVLVYGARPSGQEDVAPFGSPTVRVLKALSDETRLRILQLLTQRALYGQQLAEALGVSHPTISHHMAQLRIAGLTQTELAEDGSKTYSVRPETIETLCADLLAALVPGSRRVEGL